MKRFMLPFLLKKITARTSHYDNGFKIMKLLDEEISYFVKCKFDFN